MVTPHLTPRYLYSEHPKYNAEHWVNLTPMTRNEPAELHIEIWRKDGVAMTDEEMKSEEYFELRYFIQMEATHKFEEACRKAETEVDKW